MKNLTDSYALILFLTLFNSGCQEVDLQTTKSWFGLHDPVPPPALVDLFLAQDMSGSRNQNGIPVLSEADLDRFIELLLDQDRGGRIGFMIIDATSKDEPVVSLNIHNLNEGRPEKPQKSNQVQTAAKRNKIYTVKLRKFQRDSAAYALQRPKDIAKFKTEVLRRIQYALAHPPKGTDIMSALNTAALFLNGSNATATRTAIFLSDGIDNRYVKVAAEPEAGVEFIWVSGVPIPDKIPAQFNTGIKTTIGDAIEYVTPADFGN